MSLKFVHLLLQPQAPWLPELLAQLWGMRLAWALVLGSLSFILLSRVCVKLRGGAAAVVAMWCLVPGPASPSYWLGLAFQSPSLMSVVLCLVWAASGLNDEPLAGFDWREKRPYSWLLVASGILLGWILLGDTLAWWPISIYALGFSTFAFACVCGAAFSLWCIASPKPEIQTFIACLTIVLLLYVLTRLPSGNLWDALLDPWLWLILQGVGLRALIQRLAHFRREPKATRA